MMVVGVGYRMLPMVLPSAIPEGKSVYVSAVLLEIGVVGLFLTLVSRERWVPFFALVIAGGVAAFLGHVVWMKRHSRPARPRVHGQTTVSGMPCRRSSTSHWRRWSEWVWSWYRFPRRRSVLCSHTGCLD